MGWSVQCLETRSGIHFHVFVRNPSSEAQKMEHSRRLGHPFVRESSSNQVNLNWILMTAYACEPSSSSSSSSSSPSFLLYSTAKFAQPSALEAPGERSGQEYGEPPWPGLGWSIGFRWLFLTEHYTIKITDHQGHKQRHKPSLPQVTHESFSWQNWWCLTLGISWAYSQS